MMFHEKTGNYEAKFSSPWSKTRVIRAKNGRGSHFYKMTSMKIGKYNAQYIFALLNHNHWKAIFIGYCKEASK